LARALIVGCGCRGRALGGRLLERGWLVRGTSRRGAGREAIEAARLEAAEADPARPGTILELSGDVTVIVWLLGSAGGEREAVAAIHGPRLERLLERLVDTPVRGFAYEAEGSVGRDLRRGRAIVVRAWETWRIPIALLDGDRGTPEWAERTAAAVAALTGA
jgi:nucleoside-diphosphate-sugar epimerase